QYLIAIVINISFEHEVALDISVPSVGFGSVFAARRKLLSVRFVPEAELNLRILNGSYRES
ncbi:MAG: hypothetical protein O7D36_10485, partial [Gammaproteobacteria bacterium]|nr:hypothetical protein [Gammaproteobacteria bacterium]